MNFHMVCQVVLHMLSAGRQPRTQHTYACLPNFSIMSAPESGAGEAATAAVAKTDVPGNAPTGSGWYFHKITRLVACSPCRWSAGCVGTQSDQAGKASSCAGCPNQAACASGAGRKVDPGMSLGLHLHVTVTSCLRSRLVARSCPGSGGTVVRRESHDPGSVWQGRCWQEHRVCTASLHAGIAGQACAWWSAQPDAYRHLTCVRACSQVGLLDVDICGPSIPRMLGLSGREVHQSGSGWSPVWLDDNLGVMSIGFVLPATDDAVIWRGPRKSGTCRDPCVGLAVFAWRPMAGRS